MFENENGMFSEETREKNRITWKVKIEEEKKEILEKRSTTNLEKFGVNHSSRNLKVRRKIKQSNIKTYKEREEEIYNKTIQMNLCDYGCGKEGKFQLKNKKWCCSKFASQCSILRKKNNGGSEKKKGWTKENREGVRKRAENQRIKLLKLWKDPNSKYNSVERNEKIRQYMLNGGAIIALKGVKNPSKPELKLRKIVKELYPSSENTFKVFNYALDNAIPEHKIAIEYDGWYHFNIPGRKEYDAKRQKEIEQDGWEFIKYNIFQKFPPLEQVKEDILKALKLKEI